MILNLTQHPATPEQVAAGVVDLPAEQRAELCDLLTFEALPTRADIEGRAGAIANLVRSGDLAMIGGAPWLMAPLERQLVLAGVRPMYAFSTRESVEQTGADGSVKKVSVFRHAGFI